MVAGADVNAKNESGKTPLMYASGLRLLTKIPIIKTLIELGADVNVKNKNGKNALYYINKDDDNPVEKKAFEILKQKTKKQHLTIKDFYPILILKTPQVRPKFGFCLRCFFMSKI
ncbi:MAG: ankyrin repeat domain-containing protein [Alphaproteobacteria bacterium]